MDKVFKHYFPKLKFDFIVFGQDWLGRQFCVPIGIGEYILVLDPTTQEDGHITYNLIDFHDEFLVNNKEDFFLSVYFQQILDYLEIEEITHEKCLGLKVSVFLGGEEDISNYSLYNMEMYWDIENQLFKQISNLPSGTKIDKGLINPFTNE